MREDPQHIEYAFERDTNALEASFRLQLNSYTTALGAAALIGRGRAGMTPMERRGDWLCPLAGPFTRLLLAAHIWRILRDLENRLSQCADALGAGDDDDTRRWLLSAKQEARCFRGSLPSWRWLISAAPILSVAYGAIWPSSLSITLMGVSLILLLMAPGSVAAAYRKKRELFLPGASWLDTRHRDEQRAYAGPNLYAAEVATFTLLGSTSPIYEYELDRFVWVFYSLVVMLAAAVGHATLMAAEGTALVVIDLLGLVGLTAYLWVFIRSVARPNRVWT